LIQQATIFGADDSSARLASRGWKRAQRMAIFLLQSGHSTYQHLWVSFLAGNDLIKSGTSNWASPDTGASYRIAEIA